MTVNVTKGQSAMALYHKINTTRSTNYVENFMIITYDAVLAILGTHI